MLRMRGGAVITLMGLTALVAYSLGRQDAPTGKQTAAIVPSDREAGRACNRAARCTSGAITTTITATAEREQLSCSG